MVGLQLTLTDLLLDSTEFTVAILETVNYPHRDPSSWSTGMQAFLPSYLTLASHGSRSLWPVKVHLYSSSLKIPGGLWMTLVLGSWWLKATVTFCRQLTYPLNIVHKILHVAFSVSPSRQALPCFQCLHRHESFALASFFLFFSFFFFFCFLL
jgi:hypothetical protein